LSQSQQQLGLALPAVSLTNVTSFQLDGGSDGSDAEGTIVYNTNAALPSGKGLYVWSGSQWMAGTGLTTPPVTLASFDLSAASLDLAIGGNPGTIDAINFKGSDGNDFTAPVSVNWVLNSGTVGVGSTEDKQATSYTVTPGNSAASWTVIASAAV
jgi:hypothetical protein